MSSRPAVVALVSLCFLISTSDCQIGSLSYARYWFTASVVGTKVVFAGGEYVPPAACCSAPFDLTLNSIEVGPIAGVCNVIDIYDSATGGWNSSASGGPQLATKRRKHGAGAVGSQIYFAGGDPGWNSGIVLASVERLDMSSGTVITLAGSLSVARRLPATVVLQSQILFAGGDTGIPDTGYGPAVSTVDIYDAALNTWSVASLAVARAYMASGVVGSKAIFAGGTSASNVYHTEVDLYDSATGQWTASPSVGSLSVARAYLACAAIGSLVMFAGGDTVGATKTSTVDVYDFGSGNWTVGQPLSVARSVLGGVALPPLVIFAGGDNYPTIYNTVDIYNASSGTWNSTSTGAGSLDTARNFVVATALGNYAFFASRSIPTVDVYNGVVGLWHVAPSSCASYPPPLPGAVCFRCACTVTNPAVGANISLPAGQTVSVNGSLALLPSSVLVISSAGSTAVAPLTVTGSAELSGSLVISLNATPADGALVLVLEATDNITGAFGSVHVSQPDSCVQTTGQQVVGAGSLAVLLSTAPSCSGGLSAAAIGGIVVGGILFLCIAAVVLILVGRALGCAFAAHFFRRDFSGRGKLGKNDMEITLD